MKFREMCEIKSAGRRGNYLELVLSSESIAAESRPGQFVNIRVGEGLDPLLRRPFSICDVNGNELTLLVLVRGKGTEELARVKPGDRLNLIGPLGNPFPVLEKKPLFIAGGIGIAPFLFFARKLGLSSKPVLLFGARNQDLLPDLAPFERFCDIRLATDDGSAGLKGNVIDLLKQLDAAAHTMVACGPSGMFKALSSYYTSIGGADAWFSLETYMGCGFGACKGCTVEGTDGEYRLCCMDGPTFRWNEVKL